MEASGASALKMNADLERIGDQAINLLKRAQTLDRQPGEWRHGDVLIVDGQRLTGIPAAKSVRQLSSLAAKRTNA